MSDGTWDVHYRGGCCNHDEGKAESVLSELLNAAEFSLEYSTLTLRTPEGWLLWSGVQKGNNTLGEILRQAKKNLKMHMKTKGI